MEKRIRYSLSSIVLCITQLEEERARKRGGGEKIVPPELTGNVMKNFDKEGNFQFGNYKGRIRYIEYHCEPADTRDNESTIRCLTPEEVVEMGRPRSFVEIRRYE